MARAKFTYRHEDSQGNLVINTRITLVAPGTDTPVTAYTAASGGSAVTYPLVSDRTGRVTAWLDTAQDVELIVKDDTEKVIVDDDERPQVQVGDPSASATYVSFGPTDPEPALSPGQEYVWHKTDGAGTLLDIVSGVAS